MKRFVCLSLAPLLALPLHADADPVGEVDTVFKLIGPDHKIVVDAHDDPKVAGVTCYVSRAKTGGIKGALGLAAEQRDRRRRRPGHAHSDQVAGGRGRSREGTLASHSASAMPIVASSALSQAGSTKNTMDAASVALISAIAQILVRRGIARCCCHSRISGPNAGFASSQL